ncbi:MAG: lysophospholipase L1-like esterase [Polyangiales bacterium]|jgi:lysophospholipase L1-like esterase
MCVLAGLVLVGGCPREPAVLKAPEDEAPELAEVVEEVDLAEARVGQGASQSFSLPRFQAALQRAESGEQTRILAFGDSHVAGDQYVGRIRRVLQERYGGSRGFTLAAWPNNRGYWQADVSVEEGSGWTVLRLGAGRTSPDYYGMAGVVFDSEGRSASAALESDAPVRQVEVWYQRQPGGGELLIEFGESTRTVSTSGATGPGYELMSLTEGARDVRLRALPGGPVRIYAVVFGTEGAGVVVDNAALGGTKARYHLASLDPVYAGQLRRRAPHLVMLGFGGNEGNDFGTSINEYGTNLRRMVARIRRLTPDADCLLVGPLDKPLARDGGWVHRYRTTAIARVQRETAAEYGCAFFDSIAFMGGRMSMLQWVAADLARPDRVHLTNAGYELVADALLDAMLPLDARE